MAKKILLILLSLSMVLTALCSCTGDDSSDIDMAKKVKPAYGGTLKLACVSIDTMNPIITAHASISDFLSLIYEGLFAVKPDLKVEGVLAEGYTVSNNNTVYTIKLKDNIKFHNGKIFTAADVVSTLNYMAFYTTRYNSFMQDIAGYYADGYNTVVINLKTPRSDFANNLDFPILPTGLMSDDFIAQNQSFIPNGTGMYEYETTIAYKNIILNANEDWHGGGDRAYIDKVNVEILSDEETIISAFDAGAIDALSTSWKGFGEMELGSSLFTTFECEQNRFTFIGVNCQSIYFDTAAERRKLKESIDVQKITEDTMLGHAKLAFSPIRKGVYYNIKEDSKKTDDSQNKEEVSIGAIRLLYNSESKTKTRLAGFVRQQLEGAGYTVVADGQPYALYNDKVLLSEYELYIGEVNMANDANMQFMFSSPIGGICNCDDEELRTLVSNLDLALGEDEKIKAWEIFEKYYKNNAIQIPLYHTNRASFVNKRIMGSLKSNLSYPYYGMDNMFIEKE